GVDHDRLADRVGRPAGASKRLAGALGVAADVLGANPDLDAGDHVGVGAGDFDGALHVGPADIFELADRLRAGVVVEPHPDPSPARTPCLRRSVPIAATRGLMMPTSATASRSWLGSTTRPPRTITSNMAASSAWPDTPSCSWGQGIALARRRELPVYLTSLSI